MILITGVKGQLGSEFKKIFDCKKIEYIGTDKKELDITKEKRIDEFIREKKIKLIINCVGYNDVDSAEDSGREACREINQNSTKILAEAVKKIGGELVTFSTDFVFDGLKNKPYSEEDTPNPLSFYGKTKLKGEEESQKACDKMFLIRTSWVFGKSNNNFNYQVINWSKGNEKLFIVDDQISSPTYSRDLAEFTWELIKTKKYGLYHFSNSGEASKYDQARYLLEKINWKGEIKRAKTKDFKLKANRPKYSKLCSLKIEKILNRKIPSWQSGINRFLEEINLIK